MPALVANSLVRWMIDLEEVYKVIHCHLVVLFFCWKNQLQSSAENVFKKGESFLFPNFESIICLDVVIQFEEDLKGRPWIFEYYWGQSVQLLLIPCKVGDIDIPNSDGVFARKDLIFIFSHDGHKRPIFLGAICFLCALVHHASLSPFFDRRMLPGGRSVCRCTQFLHPNRCSSWYGWIKFGMFAPSNQNHVCHCQHSLLDKPMLCLCHHHLDLNHIPLLMKIVI